jgi:hypothetical protein
MGTVKRIPSRVGVKGRSLVVLLLVINNSVSILIQIIFIFLVPFNTRPILFLVILVADISSRTDCRLNWTPTVHLLASDEITGA